MTEPTKTPILKCPRLYKRVLPLFLAWCVFSLAIILPFGNPQWSRVVYLFQWKVWPGKLPVHPASFTGTWTDWYPNGRRAIVSERRNGKAIGKWRVWDRDGKEIYRRIALDVGWKYMLCVKGHWRESVNKVITPSYSESGVQLSLWYVSPISSMDSWVKKWVTQMNSDLKSSQ